MDYIKLALKNVSKYGDTDIFPFPMENALFFDIPDNVKEIILDMEKNFDKWISKYPVDCIKTCIPVGYMGYRWATLIDPLWNCFLLYQVLKIAETIEANRVSTVKQAVFSYRIALDEDSGKLFDQDYNWRSFYDRSIKIAESGNFPFITRFDISDFYNRIYHHRLDNALLRCNVDVNIKSKVMKILQDISCNVSYGLPIGGNAARILAEILLNPLDQMMVSKSYLFCRYVDDYIIFAKSREDAFHKLNYCAEFLFRNEGLSLQKSKTQILSANEYLSYAKTTIEGEEEEGSKERAKFMRLHIHFDPYSASAEKDYKELKSKINQFDIISLLKSELKKSRIHQALGKQILNAILILDSEKIDLAFNIIISNIENLYSIFPSVMQVLAKKILETSRDTQILIINTLYQLVENDSYILQSENNASYVVRVFSTINFERSIQGIELIYSKTTSPLVKFNCIYAMTNLNNHYWLSDIKSKFSTLSKWERRAFIPASYFLKDEGAHWREHTKKQFMDFEILVRDWVSKKDPIKTGWKIPI